MIENIATRIKAVLKRIWLIIRGFGAKKGALPPKPFNEKHRQRAVVEYGLNTPEAIKEYDEIVQQAAFICESPIALMSISDGDRQLFKSRIGLESSEAARDLVFCSYAILDPYRILEIEDTELDPRFADNPLVVGNAKIRFYAGVPLVSPEGYPLGTLCVLDQQPRKLTEDQKLNLKLLAQYLIIEIASSQRRTR